MLNESFSILGRSIKFKQYFLLLLIPREKLSFFIFLFFCTHKFIIYQDIKVFFAKKIRKKSQPNPPHLKCETKRSS